MEDNGARPKEQRGPGKVSCRHGKTNRTERNHSSTQASRRDKTIHHLSVRLYDVLDRVGASAEFRNFYQEIASSTEIIIALIRPLDPQPLRSTYIFGSSSEGSTTPGLKSDTDVLISHDRLPVICNISDAIDGHCILMIRDKHTQPGYVKLQFVYKGIAIYRTEITRDTGVSDSEGRICVTHHSVLGDSSQYDERNGPADTSTVKNIDYVNGFRCSNIPEFSKEWTERIRQYNWPSKRMIDKMTTMGCFVVGVGHPTSIDRNLEWRLSFSLQEREMMFSMNLVQHKCYIVLKMIKKDLIEPIVGKSISSYHLKTCMFHTMENTKSNIWKRRNLVQCVMLCLYVILKWVYNGYCPNYFIKEENMFDRYMHRNQRLKLIRQLRMLLSSGCGFLFLIKLDQVSAFLKNNKMSNARTESELNKVVYKKKSENLFDVSQFTETLCVMANTKTSATSYIMIMLTYLSQNKSIKDQTEQDTQDLLTCVLPFLHQQLAQSFASLAFNTYNVETKYTLLYQSGYLLRESNCYLTPSKILKATVLYKLEQYERCISELDQLELLKPRSLCFCYPNNQYFTDKDKIQIRTSSLPSILSRTAICVRFLRSDTSIIPKALQYEMYRSTNTPPESRNKHFENWFDLAVVDAVVYIHFLQYLATVKMNNSLIKRQVAIDKLESVLQREQNLGHRETGFNLLGCIFDETSQIHKAIECFWRSWQIRPLHNAAKWHLCIALYKYSSSQ